MGRGGGSRAAGAIAHMEMGEVFKTAGFRRARGRARGSCGDADRDDARRAVKGVADGLVPERHEHARGDLLTVAAAGSVSRSIAAGPVDAAGSVDITDNRASQARTLS